MNKSNLVFLDTETTGRGPESRLCQVAYKFQGEECEALFKPPVPIEVEAMSISHITNRMVADKEAFADSIMQGKLKDIFSQGNILVAHNASFDAEILKRDGLEPGAMIDTLKLAQYLDKEGEIPKYNLQYLRYYFGFEIENAIAHDALGDVRVLEKLFEYFFEKMMAELADEDEVIKAMVKISSGPILVKKFYFGKYNGSLIEDVALNDTRYLQWLLAEKIKARESGEGNDENWIYTLEYYLR